MVQRWPFRSSNMRHWSMQSCTLWKCLIFLAVSYLPLPLCRPPLLWVHVLIQLIIGCSISRSQVWSDCHVVRLPNSNCAYHRSWVLLKFFVCCAYKCAILRYSCVLWLQTGLAYCLQLTYPVTICRENVLSKQTFSFARKQLLIHGSRFLEYKTLEIVTQTAL